MDSIAGVQALACCRTSRTVAGSLKAVLQRLSLLRNDYGRVMAGLLNSAESIRPIPCTHRLHDFQALRATSDVALN